MRGASIKKVEILNTVSIKKVEILNTVSRLVSYLLILLPAVLGVLYVRAFGVSVVYSDAWSMVPLFDKWSSGTLRFSDLFRQHNEHRMFFPAGVEVLLGNLTNYDNVVEMYLIQLCLLVTLITLFFAFRDSIKSAWLFLFVPISFVVFSFRQYANMLFGYQINFAFAQTFGALALFLLYILGRRGFKKLAFMAALVSATVASFSIVSGLFVWPVGLLQLFISPLEKPTKRVLILLWSLVGLGEYAAFFIDWVKPDSVSLLYTLEHPVVGTQYFLTLLGSALFWTQSSAFVGGLLVACLALMCLIHIHKYGRWDEHSFWISLMLYSLLTLAAITGGRSVDGAEGALTARYTSLPIFVVVSVYAMLVKTAFERRSHINTILLAAFSGVILLSAAISYSNGIDQGGQQRAQMKQAAFVLSTYESQPCQLVAESLHEPANVISKRAPILQRLGYNVFSESQAPGATPPHLIYHGWTFGRNRC